MCSPSVKTAESRRHAVTHINKAILVTRGGDRWM